MSSRLLAISCIAVLTSACISAPRITTFMNPLDVPVADPQVLKDGDTYYLYGTTYSDRGIEVYSSRDLVHWRRMGMAIKKGPATWGQDCFWAPETVREGDTYYLFYTALNPQANVRNICVATAKSPLGPFTDVAAPILPVSRGFIDGHPFKDPATGQWYLYALEENLRPPQIVVAKLAADLLSVTSETKLAMTVTEEYERGWVEAPFLVEHKSTYYMMYSMFGYASPDYAVGYATAPSPEGPWTKYPGNPILKRSAAASGPGHNSAVLSPDGTELYTAYHTHLTFAGGPQRQLAIDRMKFIPRNDGPDLLVIDGPTVTKHMLPSGAKPVRAGESDEFNGMDLDWSRWLSYGEHRDHWKLEDGALLITTQDGDIHTDRWDAKNLFLQYAPKSDFRAVTKVRFAPQADYEQAFLVLWQDQSNYLRVSSLYDGRRAIEVGHETNGKFDSTQLPNIFGDELHLAVRKSGAVSTVEISSDGQKWTPVGESFETPYSVPKIGIGAIAPASTAAREARFEYLRVE